MELPQFLRYRTTEALAGIFVRELTEGIADTGVKAAFIKFAVEEHGLVGDVPRILAAVAAAHAETGAPVMVHTNAAAKSGLVALEALTAAGVDRREARDRPRRRLERPRLHPAAGRLGRVPRLGPLQHRALQPGRRSDRDRDCACSAEGYVDQLHFSHDGATFHDFMVGDPAFADEHADYLHIENVILPQLRERGVADADIDRILVDNPRRWLA